MADGTYYYNSGTGGYVMVGSATYQTTSASATSSSSSSVWYIWNDDYICTSSGTASCATAGSGELVWTHWNNGYTVRVDVATPDTDEDDKRAEALLTAYLDEKQKKDLAEKNHFEVVDKSGKRYRIKRGIAGNVFLLDEYRKTKKKFCIHPIDSVPTADAMLSQLIWLKWNEEEFLKVANVTDLAA